MLEPNKLFSRRTRQLEEMVARLIRVISLRDCLVVTEVREATQLVLTVLTEETVVTVLQQTDFVGLMEAKVVRQ